MDNYLKGIMQVVVVLAIGIGSIWIASLVTKKETPNEIVKEVVREIILKRPSCPNTSDAFSTLKNSGQFVVLAKDLNSYGGSNGAYVNKKFVVVSSSGSGSQVACGYLYVKMSGSDKRPLDLKWEHPFIKAGQFGGHIVTDNSIIPTTDNKAGELLYNLSNITYWKSSAERDIRTADWAALLNVSNRIEFEIALDTVDHSGVLEEVAIAYECWSPETGQVTRDCKLSIEN